jgi:hypothetical protein
MSKEKKPDCSNHEQHICGIFEMENVAELIGNLHYETLADLFMYLHRKIGSDCAKDMKEGRIILGNHLYDAANAIYQAQGAIKLAWERSKPFMNTPNLK